MESTTFLDRIELPPVTVEVEVKSLYETLKQVKDLRKARGQRYEAAAVLVLLILAKLAGAKTVLGVADWVQLRTDWLRTALAWPWPRFPCANTYTYLCNHIELDDLNRSMGDFFAHLGQPLATAPGPDQPDGPATRSAPPVRGHAHLVLDGKSLRGSRRSWPQPVAPQFVLGLYNASHAYMLRQMPIPGKGREQTAGLALIDQVDLHGYVVSADALHTQPRWCQQVLQQGGDYLVIAKHNQPELHADIALLFSEAPRPWLPETDASSTDKGHGRLEVRRLRTSAELDDYLAARWPGVQQVFRVERRIRRRGKLTIEYAYGMTSLPPELLPPDALLALVRHHWSIENRAHWRRDVTLGEDACKVTSGQAPQVLAALNNIVLALLDLLGVKNAARQIRAFAAAPADALALLMQPL